MKCVRACFWNPWFISTNVITAQHEIHAMGEQQILERVYVVCCKYVLHFRFVVDVEDKCVGRGRAAGRPIYLLYYKCNINLIIFSFRHDHDV